MHYMVNIDHKLEEIQELIHKKDYFIINRPRQYGKTTTMFMLEQKLKDEYLVISISFEGIGDDVFLNEGDFSRSFLELISDNLEFIDEDAAEWIIANTEKVKNLKDLSKVITNFVKSRDKDVVLFIDEVDKSANNQLFLSFLGMLRNKYLLRQQGRDMTFSSIILAGVYDIKNLKIKKGTEERKYNSPWNIAVNFDVDMSFSSVEIKTMLDEYCNENNVSIDTEEFSKELYRYTSGYPFLVSRLCQIIDEKFHADEWNEEMLIKAMKVMLNESNTLFDDLIKNVANNPEIEQYIYDLIINGAKKTFVIDNQIINMCYMFGYFKNEDGTVKVSNEIFEQRLYNYFSSKLEGIKKMEDYNVFDSFYTESGLNFRAILLKFQQFVKEQYSTIDSKFIEREGRLLFLAFIKPIINGIGFDFKEVQISEEKRLDVVITYLKEKYIIELKIWRGEEYHQKGLNQLAQYLDNQNINEGYLLIYNFNKNKEYKNEEIVIGNKKIFIVWV